MQFEFWFSEKQIADVRHVETTARYLGTALYWSTASNIRPGYDYYFYIRSVNLVGKSAFVEAVGRASDDAEGYLDFYKGLINKTHLGKELLENAELTEDNASKLEQFSKEWKDANDKWNAMWGVRIEQTEDGKHYVAGLGLSMEDTEEGKLSQFLVAASRIAFIDPANGNETPMFVAQDGQIFMNDVFLKRLTAPTITGGGNPPVFSLTPDGKLTARNADISGSITASSGTLNNVTINQDCVIKGNLSAAQITGDIAKTYVLNGNSVYIPAQVFTMNLVMLGGAGHLYFNGNEQTPVSSAILSRMQTDSVWSGGSPGHGGGSYRPVYSTIWIKVFRLNAGTPVTVSVSDNAVTVIWMSKA
ncbi:host specificity protein [Escherichia coli]|nr:host specificity protein [Escherichia coli]